MRASIDRSCLSCGSDATGNPMAAINSRCLEKLDLGAISVINYDGRSR